MSILKWFVSFFGVAEFYANYSQSYSPKRHKVQDGKQKHGVLVYNMAFNPHGLNQD